MTELEAWRRPQRVCTRCVMGTADPLIRFDARGVCNLCTEFMQRRLAVTAYKYEFEDSGDRERAGEDSPALQSLWQRVRASRRSGSAYDCIVGISGGVDSSYTAYLASKAGLRVLGVHMDNGWDTPVALRNVLNVVQRLGTGYQAAVLDWNNFREIQKAFIAAGVPEIETPTDIAIQAVLHRAAARHDVRWILSGGNIAGEGILPAAWFYNARDTRYSHAILKNSNLPTERFREINFGFWTELRARIFQGIRTVYPLNHIRYRKDEAIRLLRERLDWRPYGGKHSESTFTRFAQMIYLPVRHGVDYRRAHLSTEICLGHTSRDAALAQLELAPYADLDADEDTAFVARKLLMPPEVLKAATKSTARWYFDFPHNSRLLGVAYDSYRLLTGRSKASNF
jgi:hypothetical protein